MYPGVRRRPLRTESAGMERDLERGQGQIVAVATFVIDLEAVASGGEDETIRKIFELAGNGSRRGVVDDDNHCAPRKNCPAIIEEGELRLAVNRDPDRKSVV